MNVPSENKEHKENNKGNISWSLHLII